MLALLGAIALGASVAAEGLYRRDVSIALGLASIFLSAAAVSRSS